ncbi:hypothetical protein [Yinghuangia seranimata]|uniref:hypothetical protein n=1 Tax=Yinghuangia seranimata TaxID=408067 RepID=UPI00248C367B|nr:hypothetical protein [Yinghuangia seranimata]MDI2129004.1 hypothetical protein [Yinghuangia seranimata]
MSLVTVGCENGEPVELYLEDKGRVDPAVPVRGRLLSGRSGEHQARPLVEAGRRVITHDRRGFGAAPQPWGGSEG